MAMLLHPEVQHKAREEIDRVVGSERLPEMGDRAQLPYIEAIVKECLRWRPVLPAGLAHKLTADFEYDGYFLPSGAMVIPAVWYVRSEGNSSFNANAVQGHGDGFEAVHEPGRFQPRPFHGTTARDGPTKYHIRLWPANLSWSAARSVIGLFDCGQDAGGV